MKKLQAGIRQAQAKCIPLHQHPVFPQQELKPVATKALQQKNNNQQLNRRHSLQRHSPINQPPSSLNGTLPLDNLYQLGKGTTSLYQPRKSRKRGNKRLVSATAKSSLKRLRERTNNDLKRLGNQAERINQLSAELEAAILQLKAIASEVNQDWRELEAIQKPTTDPITLEVCEYRAVSTPIIQQKPCGSLVLLSRPVNLGKIEPDAGLLKQTLRRVLGI